MTPWRPFPLGLSTTSPPRTWLWRHGLLWQKLTLPREDCNVAATMLFLDPTAELFTLLPFVTKLSWLPQPKDFCNPTRPFISLFYVAFYQPLMSSWLSYLSLSYQHINLFSFLPQMIPAKNDWHQSSMSNSLADCSCFESPQKITDHNNGSRLKELEILSNNTPHT